MEKFNAKGMACPLPVIQTKKLLEENDAVETTVDNLVATQNLEKLAKQSGYSFSSEKISEEEYRVVISKKDGEKPSDDGNIVSEAQPEKINGAGEKASAKAENESYIAVIDKDVMGHGSEELGKKLIKAFFYALTEQEKLPGKIIFYNGGANLVDRNRSHVLKELEELRERGVEIVCCGACIDYYGVELGIGNPTNMYFIVEDMRKADRILKP